MQSSSPQTTGEIEIDADALATAQDEAYAVMSEDMKILMDYGDGKGFQETDEDDCVRHLVSVAIEAYLRATRR